MSSVCCVNCFNDNAIKRVIISLSQLGRCHYCNQNNAPIISIDNLLKYQLKSKHVFITKTL